MAKRPKSLQPPGYRCTATMSATMFFPSYNDLFRWKRYVSPFPKYRKETTLQGPAQNTSNTPRGVVPPFVRLRVCACPCMRIRLCVCVHTCAHAHVCVNVSVCVYVNMHVCVRDKEKKKKRARPTSLLPFFFNFSTFASVPRGI